MMTRWLLIDPKTGEPVRPDSLRMHLGAPG